MVKVSLRGSLADEIYRLNATMQAAGHEDVKGFIEELIISDDEDLVVTFEGDYLVIGRKSDKGMFPPDW